jgi:hypothetical protein
LVVALGAALVLTAGSSAVVGGSPTEIQQAPWQVLVAQVRNGRTIGTCGGSIVDASHVVTAAHCVYGNFSSPVPPSTLAVRAGISDYVTPRAGDAEQTRAVVGYRIHPGYQHRADHSFDDVAVLALDVPLDLSGPTARSVSLPSAGSTFLSAQPAMLIGFGQQAAGTAPNGSLYRIDASLEEQGACGTYNAVVLCAVSPTGSACSGDSGSGLIIGSALAGIASTARNGCPAGGRVVYTNVAAPEILRFIQGEDAPPAAPHRLQGALLDAPPAMQVGQTVTCSPGIWTNEPTFTYRFLDHDTAQVLQQGRAATYTLRPADVGRTLRCAVAATTAGGTGASLSQASAKVAPSATIAAAAAAARPGESVKLRVTLAGVGQVTGRAQICVKPAKRVGATACRTAALSGAPGSLTTTVPVRIAAAAPAVKARVAVSASLSDGRKLTTVGFVTVRR